MPVQWQGVYPALLTPFTKDDKLDLPLFEKNLETQHKAGVQGAVKQFYPTLQEETPPLEKVWYGYRPCSADGLPYIGKAPTISNLTIATGHSMLGLSLGAGTGKLVREIVDEVTPFMDLKPFTVNRF
jgi:D-amino-acid dehydrogenase